MENPTTSESIPQGNQPNLNLAKLLLVVGGLLVVVLVPVIFIMIQGTPKKAETKTETITNISTTPNDQNILANDTQRLSDAQELVTSLKIYQANNSQAQIPEGPFCSPKTIATIKDKAVDGTGWLPIPVNKGATSVLLPLLPVDPNPSLGNRYIYRADKNSNFEISVVQESGANHDRLENDGGNDPLRYEKGTTVSLDTSVQVCP